MPMRDGDEALVTPDPISLERRMARSAAWMIGLRVVDRGIGLISVLVVARILVPADFGLVAMGTVILGALDAMTTFGFELALIKARARDRARLNSAWTLNVLIGGVVAASVLVLTPVAVALYDEPRVQDVMIVLAGSAFVAGFRNIGMVVFEQELRFGPIVALALVRRIGAFVITLSFALTYGTYWSLLAGMLTGHLVDVALSYRISSYRPRLQLTAWRELFSFSVWLLLNNLLAFAGNRGGDLVVGSRAGATAVGTYTVSYELASLPTTEMVWPVMRAVFPGYAQMARDRTRLAQGFVRVFSLVLLFAWPAAAGIAVLAEPFVLVLLGPRWTDAIPLIQVLALYGAVRTATANTWSAYLALDRPKLVCSMSALNLVLAFGGFTLALGTLPLEQAAWFVVGGGALAAMVNLEVLRRLLQLTRMDLVRPVLRPTLGIAVMIAVLQALSALWWKPTYAAPLAAAVLLLLVLAGAASYLAGVLVAWRAFGRPVDSAEHAVLSTVRAWMRRSRNLAGTGAG